MPRLRRVVAEMSALSGPPRRETGKLFAALAGVQPIRDTHLRHDNRKDDEPLLDRRWCPSREYYFEHSP